eukprot:m.192916 g.192916  ORF g.192916 m.192916 type:complete len:59 (-) comp18612_c0_seq12:2149-2325(-)
MMAEASFPIERNHSESLTHLLLRPSSEHGTAHDSPSTNHGRHQDPQEVRASMSHLTAS